MEEERDERSCVPSDLILCQAAKPDTKVVKSALTKVPLWCFGLFLDEGVSFSQGDFHQFNWMKA